MEHASDKLPNSCKKFVVSVVNSDRNNAGIKAKEDIDTILQRDCGMQVVKYHLPVNNSLRSKVAKLVTGKVLMHNFGTLKGLSKSDLVVLHYPIYSQFLLDNLKAGFGRGSGDAKHRAKLVIIVHDLESLRVFKGDTQRCDYEMKFLNNADCLIVHSEAMVKHLRRHGVTAAFVILPLFDYLHDYKVGKSSYNKTAVSFAGNLVKSTFLSNWDVGGLGVKLYGNKPNYALGKGLDYVASFSPTELVEQLRGGWGLVWDGDQLATCGGQYGSYLKYNKPHKASLYLSAGLPIICWSQSALADYVVSNKLGIAVDSLVGLEQRLQAVSDDEFSMYWHNAIKVGNDLRAGLHTKRALAEAYTKALFDFK